MFFLFSKEKIKSYLVSLSTIIILLAMSLILGNKTINPKENNITQEVSSKIEENRN